MIASGAKIHPTIADAAKEFGVSAKTVREWIRQHIIDSPPTFEYGLRTVMYFPPEYLRKAKEQVRRHKDRLANSRNRKGK
jgi:transposase-like protein